MKNAIDILIDKIKETNNPTVMGLDTRYDMIPNCIKEKYNETLEGISKAIIEFNRRLIDATFDIIPANPYMGIDSIKPFLEDCKKYNKGVFILVKTSNPSSGDLQDVKLENGEEVYLKKATS